MNNRALAGLKENRYYRVLGSVTALEEALLKELMLKNIKIHANRLLTSYGFYKEYGDICILGQHTLIPDGHAVVKGNPLYSVPYEVYGDRVYVDGDLTINSIDSLKLNDFKSIVVVGRVSMPLSLVSSFKQIGRSKEIFAYEGELLRVENVETLNHAQLHATGEEGISYTIGVDGRLVFAEYVTREDLSCINSVYNNGVIVICDELRPTLLRTCSMSSFRRLFGGFSVLPRQRFLADFL